MLFCTGVPSEMHFWGQASAQAPQPVQPPVISKPQCSSGAPPKEKVSRRMG